MPTSSERQASPVSVTGRESLPTVGELLRDERCPARGLPVTEEGRKAAPVARGTQEACDCPARVTSNWGASRVKSFMGRNGFL